MGQRANLIVIEGGRAEIFYTHWRANTLTTDLFWGPKYGVTLARAQERAGPADLLDEVWAEAGALIDLDQESLLLFGGEDLRCDVPLRRLYLRLLAHAWSGWRICWAYEGVCDIADRLDIPRAHVLVEPESAPPVRLTCAAKCKCPFVQTVASLTRVRGEMLLVPAPCRPQEYLIAGPDILNVDESNTVAVYRPVPAFPTGGGFHIDEAQRSIEVWNAGDAPHLMTRVSAAWPDWNVTWYQDHFEFQIARTNGRFDVALATRDELIRRLRESLLYQDRVGAVDRFLQITELLAKQGEKITAINPHALREARLTLPVEERTKIIDAAFAAL
ncbi:MAG TPA: hypothetical protein VGI81_18925 [Tepidisphaeraceae bacterium]|jgi:hypothetical protein